MLSLEREEAFLGLFLLPVPAGSSGLQASLVPLLGIWEVKRKPGELVHCCSSRGKFPSQTFTFQDHPMLVYCIISRVS